MHRGSVVGRLRRRLLRLLGAVAVALLTFVAVSTLVVTAAGSAGADSPVTLSRTGQITDKVGALGDRTSSVTQALNRLYDTDRIQLFVVYVRNFSGLSAQAWADQTAARNGLGLHDVLLAVATHDRQYAYSVEQGFPLSKAQLDEVAAKAIAPPLRSNDWAGAAIGAANGYSAVLAGQPIPNVAITPGPADPGASSSNSDTADIVVPLVVVGGAGAVGLAMYSRRKRSVAEQGAAGSAAEQVRLVPLPELDSQARQVLVATDDAIRTSDEELGFATAEFGEEAVAPFAAALTEAKGDLTAAFRLRQQLDDAFPEDDETKRKMLDEIIERCDRANRRLDAESASFDRLRALVEQAPTALASVDESARAGARRLTAAEAALLKLHGEYAPSAFEGIDDNPAQARDRLAFAASAAAEARRAVGHGENRAAAVPLRAAEAAVEQAGALIDGIERRAGELEEAAGRVPEMLRTIETDLADARGMLSGVGSTGVSTGDLSGRIARAESVVTAVKTETATRHDPIAALRRLEEADALLAEALAQMRQKETNDQRARTLLDQALLAARSEIGVARDFITTRRGAVGSEARTRLAEAERHLAQASAVAATDPANALTHAQQADSLAQHARRLAESDLSTYQSRQGGGGAGGSFAGGLGGAILGGIILGGMGGGGGGGRGRGGMGGGGWGGAPGSFGGGGTRGRLGGGGRF